MAIEIKLPLSLWTEVVATANYLINLTSTRANNGDTPYGRFTRSKSSAKHLKVFSCKTYMMDTSLTKKKRAPRVYECIFLAYNTTSTGYHSYHTETRKALISKDVRFHEDTFPLNGSILHKPTTLLEPDHWQILEDVAIHC